MMAEQEEEFVPSENRSSRKTANRVTNTQNRQTNPQQIIDIRLPNRNQNELNVIQEESLSRQKSHNTTTDDEGDSSLEVDEKVAFAHPINPQNSKRLSKKQRRKKKKSKGMVKKVPNFFGLDSTEVEEESVVSVYTEVARKLLVKELEGKERGNIYEVMINDNFSKKPKSHKKQRQKDAMLSRPVNP